MNVKHEDEGHTHHSKAYTLVWLALLVFTAITVYVSYFDFGEWNIFVAMLVATIKAALVCLFFMHLKYDNRMDQVVFCSAFVFLAIFIGLTLSDTLARPVVTEAKVHEIQGPAGDQSAKMLELSKTTPPLVEKGKSLFQQNCVACHGAEGKGDGAAAAALNPKPRNFTVAEGWKNGRAPAQVFKTLTNGIQGGSMAAFATLSIEDRWALTHYVDSLAQTPPPADTAAMLAEIGVKEGSEANSAPIQEQVEIPIQFAIERMLQEAVKK